MSDNQNSYLHILSSTTFQNGIRVSVLLQFRSEKGPGVRDRVCSNRKITSDGSRNLLTFHLHRGKARIWEGESLHLATVVPAVDIGYFFVGNVNCLPKCYIKIIIQRYWQVLTHPKGHIISASLRH